MKNRPKRAVGENPARYFMTAVTTSAETPLEIGKLGDPESRVEKDPDNEFLFMGIAGVGQAGCFISSKRFAFVLIGVSSRNGKNRTLSPYLAPFFDEVPRPAPMASL